MSETAVDVTVDWLADTPRLPDRCVRHGLPTVRRVDLAVKSRPKIAPRRKVLLPGYTSLNRADEYLRQVKVTRVSGWPLCAQCVRERTLGLILAGVLFFGGLAAMLVAFVVGALADGPQPLLAVPILGGFAAILASPLALRWGGLPRLTQAETTDDGAAVRVVDPHPEFAAQLPQ
jgi:hypothetical protein